MNVLDGVNNSLRQQAQKSATEELKKVAIKINEHNKGIRLAREKVEKEVAEHEKSVLSLHEDAERIVKEFEADWGPWSNKVEVVKGE